MTSIDYLMTLISQAEPLGYVEGEETSFEAPPEALAEKLGYPTWFTISGDDFVSSLRGAIECGMTYRPWTFRLSRGEPFVVMFSHDADAVHFRMLSD